MGTTIFDLMVFDVTGQEMNASGRGQVGVNGRHHAHDRHRTSRLRASGIDSMLLRRKRAPGRNRTCNRPGRNRLLYPLSYGRQWKILGDVVRPSVYEKAWPLLDSPASGYSSRPSSAARNRLRTFPMPECGMAGSRWYSLGRRAALRWISAQLRSSSSVALPVTTAHTR